MVLNRSERRAMIKAEAKKLKKEGKKNTKGGQTRKLNGYKTYELDTIFPTMNSVAPAFESTDSFAMEYIDISSVEEDDNITHYVYEEFPSSTDIVLEQSPLPSIVLEEQPYFEDQIDIPDKSTLACTTDLETQEISNTKLESTCSRYELEIPYETVQINETEQYIPETMIIEVDKSDISQETQIQYQEIEAQYNEAEVQYQETTIGSEHENIPTDLSPRKETCSLRDTSIISENQASIKLKEQASVKSEKQPSIIASSLSTISYQEIKPAQAKAQPIYNHQIPFESDETLKSSTKKMNAFYRVFKKKSEKIQDAFSPKKEVKEKSKKSWKLWKKIPVINVS